MVKGIIKKSYRNSEGGLPNNAQYYASCLHCEFCIQPDLAMSVRTRRVILLFKSSLLFLLAIDVHLHHNRNYASSITYFSANERPSARQAHFRNMMFSPYFTGFGCAPVRKLGDSARAKKKKKKSTCDPMGVLAR